MTEPTATGIIRAAFQEPDHADQQHPRLVPTPRPRLRRPRRAVHLLLPHLAARLGVRLDPRLAAAAVALPAAWTAAMIALAWTVRY